ncbi:fimbrial protein [Erwinia billingiae]|uniref:fimbrial protein n=1 Tax=Erwinia billingiae TaxID=182337 RepID=UPI001246C927|nr:fimbrial protein [Erwinia billingiae]QEW32582.1 type 1 fimbrial protein [Erwinia billingiae]
MKQQKRTLATAATLCSMFLLCANAVAASDTAKINIGGKILANTCTIEKNSYDVTLNSISDRDIKGAGKVSDAAKEVPVRLTGCGADVTTVVVTASGSGSNNYFANSVDATAGGATGVGIIFYQTDKTTPFNSNGSVKEISDLNASGDTTLIYTAKYIATADNVTAGDVRTAVSLQFDYQ